MPLVPLPENANMAGLASIMVECLTPVKHVPQLESNAKKQNHAVDVRTEASNVSSYHLQGRGVVHRSLDHNPRNLLFVAEALMRPPLITRLRRTLMNKPWEELRRQQHGLHNKMKARQEWT